MLYKTARRKKERKTKEKKTKEKKTRVMPEMGAIMTQAQRMMERGMLLLLMWMFVKVSILGGEYVESEGEGIGVVVLREKAWMKRAKGIRRCLRLWLL
jgi:hypothetical protein